MRIVFMGTPEFSIPSLKALINSNHTVSAVVSAPDKPRGRGRKISPTPVKEMALTYGIPILQPADISDPGWIEELRVFNPECIVVVAYRILPRDVFAIPPKGTFNLHASLLPRYRGAAPINWAIINGETESGVTTFFIQEKVDAGSMILQKGIPIPKEMTAGELHDKLMMIGAEAVMETVELIDSGRVSPVRQDETLASPAPKLTKEICKIRWDHPAERVANLVRGLSPYPAAWTLFDGKMMKILRAHVMELPKSGNNPGTILAATPEGIVVSTAKNGISITELQPESRKPMSASEFLRGYKIGIGKRFAETQV